MVKPIGKSDHLDPNTECSNTVQFGKNARFATMQFLLKDLSYRGYGDQHHVTRFTYSFTKDNLAHDTQEVVSHAKTNNKEKYVCGASL